jgi:gamma-glutamyltranspeptidase/glutathione hydrolase
VALLEQRGHGVVVMDTMGSAQTVMVTDDGLFGAADPRRPGALALGY